jgi:hypothetical protein
MSNPGMPVRSAEEAKSYRYLRIAMVGLLLALAAAVLYQSSRQGSVLASVSAYYYTPAQAVFVGALIGLGACMIALQGMNDAEDTFLNLGGMFAIVVALVPTGRGPDFKSAVQACQKQGGTLLTAPRGPKLDCPTVQALENATRANVENNMAALLIVGGLALILAGVILFKGRKDKSGTRGRRWVLAAYSAAALLWLGGLAALAASVAWLADNGHYIAAGGLLLCILLVAGANAHRERSGVGGVPKGDVPKSPRAHLYTRVAVAMLVVAGIFIVLWLTNVISLFLVEMRSLTEGRVAVSSRARPASW